MFALIIVVLSGCQGPTDWYKQGMELYRQQKYVAAIEMFDRAIEGNRAHYDACVGKGDSLFYLERYFEAVQSFKQAPWSRIASHKEAREAVDKAIEEDEADASLWTLKGDFLREKSGQDEALQCYDKALLLNPKSVEAWSGKYYSLRDASRSDEAERWRQAGIDAGVL